YTLEYAWTKPQGGTWRLVEGDLKSVEGSYQFAAAGAKTTATCSQAVDVGFWIPGPIRRTFERKALQDSVEEFRKAVEKRAAGRRGWAPARSCRATRRAPAARRTRWRTHRGDRASA